jgi:predicted transcriptional regulator
MFLPQKDSPHYKLLVFFVFLKDYSTFTDIQDLNPEFCTNRRSFYFLARKLSSHGYLDSGKNNSYKITQKGIFYINCYDRINLK